MKCHYEGTGYLEGRCIGTKGIDPCIGYERCATFKSYKMTNAELIRIMSDEELAVTLTAAACGCLATEAERRLYYKTCLDFLKQPAKDGEGE